MMPVVRRLLNLFFVISQFSKLKASPLCQVIQKGTNPFSRTFSQLVFDMKHEIAHVLSNDDSISFQLAQVLG